MTTAPVSPAVLRALLLGSLGLPFAACGGTADTSARAPLGDGATGVACTSPAPLLPGIDTGIYRCAEGYLHRAAARECPSRLPRTRLVLWPWESTTGVDAGRDAGDAGDAGHPELLPDGAARRDDCRTDSDCAAPSAHCELEWPSGAGFCSGLPFGGFPPADTGPSRVCESGCRTDADCAPSELCVCGEDIGYCAPVSAAAGCHSDSDCGGLACLQNATTGFTSPATFACQLPGDRCETSADCGFAQDCVISETGRGCQPQPVCGRPFLVESEARSAGSVRSDCWRGPEALAVPPVDAALAERLAAHWIRTGLMEHASVAAFARFTLQLLALGAPHDLVRDAIRAQEDETRHARVAFELASAYAGRPIGPGPLCLDGVMTDSSAEEVLRLAIREGCIGETRAALEAAEAARAATSPVLKAVLDGIAGDEGGHAALAWRFADWLLTEHPGLLPVAQQEFERASTALVATSPGAGDAAALEHGLPDAASIASVHRLAAREVILPCARALLGRVRLRASQPLSEAAVT